MLQVKISRLYKNYLRFIITTLEKKKACLINTKGHLRGVLETMLTLKDKLAICCLGH